jgi:HK97 family phage prohead protease
MIKAFEYKGMTPDNGVTLIKDVDKESRTVTGYFSVFGNVDSDGDMIMPGAFKRTLANNLRRIKHLWQHNPHQPLSSASTENLTVKEDGIGLYFESKMNNTSWGRDAIEAYLSGTVDEHSIGFNTVNQTKKQGYNELTELKLWEGSSVTWAANPEARTSAIKSLSKEQAFEKMQISLKSFREGTYENEEIFDLLEIYTKQLQQHILDLTEGSTPPVEPTPAPQKGLKSEDLILLNTTLLKTRLSIQTL